MITPPSVTDESAHEPVASGDDDGQHEAIDDGSGLVQRAVTYVEQGQQLALARDRPDLAQHLEVARVRLSERLTPVAVVGEFKRGKSTLVNALLQTAVCPVDADVVTAVPTLVRYGDAPLALAYVDSDSADGEPRTESVPLDAISEFVSESGNPGNRRNLRSVEVQLRHRMLRSGLCLVDTPGVGGLDSAHGVITLSALDLAQGLLFVTDASQELTGPELEFLTMALERCPSAACVVTKTDLYPEWRRIVELDEGHLRRAGLQLPVIPVSSFLRLRSRRDPALLEESGFRALVEFLAAAVVSRGSAQAAQATARDVRFVAGQLGRQVTAEQSVVERPHEAPQVVAQLAKAQTQTARLASATATWQQALSDGVQDLVANIEHDIQTRLRNVLHDVEVIIDQGDPKDSWADIEVWLRRQVVTAAVANGDALAERAEQLASDVADRFELEAGSRIELGGGAPIDVLAGIELATAESLNSPTGRLGSMLLAARATTFLPMALFGVAGSFLGALTVVLAPVAVVLTGVIGRKIIKDERKRQVAFRRQQAKFAVRRYVEEVAPIVLKESRDALRRTQRQLRDEFQARAAAIHRSSVAALSAAQGATELGPEDRKRRAARLAVESAKLQQMRQELTQLAGLAMAGAGRG